MSCVGEMRSETVGEIPHTLFERVMKFTGGRLSDDMALLSISIGGEKNA